MRSGVKKISLSWYIQLNLMVLGFLFVMFLVGQVKSPQFQTGLKVLLDGGHQPSVSNNKGTSVRIQSPVRPLSEKGSESSPPAPSF